MINYIEFYDYSSGSRKLIGSVEWDKEEIKYINVPESLIKELNRGITLGGNQFFEEDGLDFLKAIQLDYTRGYFKVSNIKTKKKL